MVAYLIHDPARTDRDPYVAEAGRQIPDLEIVAPVPARSPIMSCHATHRRIWETGATVAFHETICVLEDDVKFTPTWTTDFWCKCEAWLLRSSYDVLLGGVSHAGNPKPITEPLFTPMAEVERFTATHCYLVKPTAIPLLLSGTSGHAGKHADAAISDTRVRKAVVVPFVATQWAGRSDIRQIVADDGWTFTQAEHRLLKQLGLTHERLSRR
jgi:hypothetical protein